MNHKLVFKNLGYVLVCEACLMLIPLATAVIYRGKDISSFTLSIIITAVAGAALVLIRTDNKTVHPKEGVAIVSISWVLISLFGALPFYISGTIPNFIDCLFETVSGFTTTGATILTEIESLEKGILLWRSFTHWIGGLGVLVFFLAILPKTEATSLNIMNVESTGPKKDKMLPRTGQVAKVLYLLYSALTIVLVVLLLAGGMPLFDAFIHAFGTAGTGGFSNKNISVGFYESAYINIVLSVFMLMFGTNLSLVYFAVKGNVKSLFTDSEFRFYVSVVGLATISIAFSIYGTHFRTFSEALMHAFFQVASIITTTGYATTDFNHWSYFCKMILLLLMFVGGCAGSTAGGLKNIRILLLLKTALRDLAKIIHPKAVKTVKINGKNVEEGVLSAVSLFFFAYIFIFFLTSLVLTLEGHDFEIAFSAAATCISNVGPGFGAVGPMGNFSIMSDKATILLTLNMLIGRLEIFPILMLLVPSFWKRVNI
ncbi:TrkH family potassium uptake protein [Bacillota bacterium]